MPAKKYNIVFMGTPHFAVPSLRALHMGGHNIVAVYTQPPRPAGRGQKETPSPVQQYAEANHLPVFTPVSLKDPQAQAQFAAHHADLAVVAAYGLLLPKPILEAYPLGCINVHPSALPRWRGAAPLQRTIMAGDTKTAIVIMQMNEGLDTGDMLLSEPYDIPPGTTAGRLHDTLAERAGPLLLKTLEQRESLAPTPQPAEGVTYAAKISKADCAINWNQPAQAVYQHILGLSPMPCAFFMYQGQAVKVYEATMSSSAAGAPGTVQGDALTVACASGSVTPTLIQFPGGRRMRTAEALRGHPIPHGTVLA